MAKENSVKEGPVADVLKKLREEETELMAKLKPIQEAIVALEKIVDKSVKKTAKPAPSKPKKNQEETKEIFEEISEN